MMEKEEGLDVFENMAEMLEVWSSIAWSKMGLRADIMSGKTAKDMGQAKVAIEVASFLATSLEGRLDEEDRRRVQGIVRDLKINYVQKSREGI